MYIFVFFQSPFGLICFMANFTFKSLMYFCVTPFSMLKQVTFCLEYFHESVALKRHFCSVNCFMFLQHRFSFESLLTNSTLKWDFSCMNSFMNFQTACSLKSFLTKCTKVEKQQFVHCHLLSLLYQSCHFHCLVIHLYHVHLGPYNSCKKKCSTSKDMKVTQIKI